MVRYHFYEGLIEGNFEDIVVDTGEDQDYAYEAFRQRIKRIQPRGERLVDPIDNISNRILFVSFTPEFEPPYGGRNA